MSRSRSLRPLALLLTALVLAYAPLAQDLPSQIDVYLAAAHDAGRFDGSALVSEGGEVIYERGFGQADRSWGIPNAPDTRFRIASLTKQFTAALVLQLVEAGEIDLETVVTTYLPDYPAAQGDRVTVHQLLSHTSGIPEHLGLPGFDAIKRTPYEPDAFLEVFSGLPLDFEPGTQHSYSNSNYYLLGVIIEHVTGQSYADALRDRLLAPLGLEDTGYDDGIEVIDRMASGYTRAGDSYEHATYFDPSVPYAAGMMYSTAQDLFKWTQALAQAAPFQNPETLTLMMTPVLEDYAYGIGVTMLPVGPTPVRAFGHSGGTHGFSTFMLHFPDQDRTVVVLANTEGSVQPIALNLARLLYGGTVETPKRPVGLAISRVLEDEGIEAGIARYREIRDLEADAYDLGENELNMLGYLLLGRGDLEDAVRIFELNVEMYPESWNPHDSLGEAYLEAGDRERAVESYRRAVALNPGSQSSRDVLTQLGVDLEDATVRVPVAVLERYVGTYAIQPGMVVAITLEDGRLSADAPGQPRLELVPTSESQFYVAALDARIRFMASDGEPAEGMILNVDGQEMNALRVE